VSRERWLTIEVDLVACECGSDRDCKRSPLDLDQGSGEDNQGRGNVNAIDVLFGERTSRPICVAQ